nr:venom polypeptide precursor [Doratifera vulnerans]
MFKLFLAFSLIVLLAYLSGVDSVLFDAPDIGPETKPLTRYQQFVLYHQRKNARLAAQRAAAEAAKSR